MKVGELLSVSEKILKTLHNCGIKADSYTYLPLYEDYKRLVSEGEKIVTSMTPKSPWNHDTWKMAMEKHGFELEREPQYNSCALYATMNMIMSDSSQTLSKYIDEDKLFKAVYDLAVDKLTDKDGKFIIRKYFNV